METKDIWIIKDKGFRLSTNLKEVIMYFGGKEQYEEALKNNKVKKTTYQGIIYI